MKPVSYSIGVLALAVLFGLPAFAQAPPVTAPQMPTVKATVEEVLLDIIVRDRRANRLPTSSPRS